MIKKKCFDPNIKILISERQINRACKKAAKKINQMYMGKQPVVLGILKGCIPFYAKMFMMFRFKCLSDFMVVSSYKGERKAIQKPELTLPNKFDVKDKDVIILEDVIDSGLSLKMIHDYLKSLGAKSIFIVCLVNKSASRKVDFHADMTLFEAPNEFLIGFGLDDDEYFRNLPFIGAYKVIPNK